MKSRGQMRALLHQYRIALIAGEHLGVLADAADNGRADEHRFQAAVHPLRMQMGDAAVQLTAIGIALHLHVH